MLMITHDIIEPEQHILGCLSAIARTSKPLDSSSVNDFEACGEIERPNPSINDK